VAHGGGYVQAWKRGSEPEAVTRHCLLHQVHWKTRLDREHSMCPKCAKREEIVNGD
jgi:hypothetical protein